MEDEFVGERRSDYPSSKYTETLLFIAGVEVLFTWTFLVLVGLFPSNAIGSIPPIAAAVGFATVGLGILEFGVIVLNVQLVWLLPEDHDESGIAPFLCGYCLLAQSLLMFPPLIIFAIVLVPLVLTSIAGVGWYFQKFTSLKLAKPNRIEFQNPLSIRAILWMPVFTLVLGALPIATATFFGPYVFEFAVSHKPHLGVALICSAMGMISISLLPLVACYGFLILSQSGRMFQVTTVTLMVLSLALSILIESLAKNSTSTIMPLASLAIFMFLCGVWVGLKPWRNDGLQVVFAKPTVRGTEASEIQFDDVH